MAVDRTIANLDGAVALPRKNGELVFHAPWEGRAFGLAVVLNEKGAYPGNDFRTRLVERIASGCPDYYENWLSALEALLVERGLITRDAYREGSVGWMGDRAAWRLQDGTEVPFRLTAIFHKENGDWKIVQFHTSVGVPNESTVGMALPT